MFVSEFIYLEYSQILASFISTIISYNLTKNSLDITEYLPLKVCFCLVENIVNKSQYDLNLLDREFGEQIQNFNESEITIALFPLILYHSQNITQLEKDLELITQILSLRPTQLDSIKIYIALVVLITENKIIEQKYLDNIQDKLEEIEKDKLVLINVEKIKQIIDRKLTLLEVEKQLLQTIEADNLATYQALYSFLSLPNNFEISLQRSSHFNQFKLETTILTGFLLGLKNGYLTIPYQWRKTIEQENMSLEIAKLSEKLVAKWQGKLI